MNTEREYMTNTFEIDARELVSCLSGIPIAEFKRPKEPLPDQMATISEEYYQQVWRILNERFYEDYAITDAKLQSIFTNPFPPFQKYAIYQDLKGHEILSLHVNLFFESWIARENTNKVLVLKVAASIGLYSIVDTLIKTGVNPAPEGGITPLEFSVRNGRTAIVSLLLTNNSVKKTVLDRHLIYLATKNGHKEIVRLLLSAISKQDFNKDKKAFTAMAVATQKGYFEIAWRLLAKMNTPEKGSDRYDAINGLLYAYKAKGYFDTMKQRIQVDGDKYIKLASLSDNASPWLPSNVTRRIGYFFAALPSDANSARNAESVNSDGASFSPG